MPKLNDSDPKKWEIPAHTRAKHDILRRYLDGWFPVLGHTSGRILFIDGFAGRGVYRDGTPGSPIIALSRLLDHSSFAALRHREFVFMFIEHDSDNAASLNEELRKFEEARSPWPANVTYSVINEKFEDVVDQLIEMVESRQSRLAPLFAFVDPFGFQGLGLEKLKALTNYPRSELFINFAANNVNRFLQENSVQTHIESLFGCTREEILQGWDGRSVRLPHLRAVYGERLSGAAKFPHVQSFEMRNDSGNVSYYLFHATRDSKGVQLMKDAMWKADPSGSYSFSDRLAGEEVLFELTPDLSPLWKHLETKFRGYRVQIQDLADEVLLRTPYRRPHLTEVLTAQEKRSRIKVERPGRSGYPTGTIVEF